MTPPEPASVLSEDQRQFLASHRWCLLGTVRRDGRPQVSMLAYAVAPDGTIVLSTHARSAKVRNLRRRDDATVTVTDDRWYLTVAGTAEIVDDEPRRSELTRIVLASLLERDATRLRADLDTGLDVVGRVALVVTPSSAVGRVQR
jgi:PPOX class probable F420-dependent enzyme